MKSIQITDDLHRRLKVYTSSNGIQIGKFVEKLIKDYLENNK